MSRVLMHIRGGGSSMKYTCDKKSKFYFKVWCPTDPVTQQPLATTYSSVPLVTDQGYYNEDVDGKQSKPKPEGPLIPLPPVNGVPCGLEFLVDLDKVIVKPMIELFDIMKEYETDHYKLYNIVNGNNLRMYFAAVNSTERENCYDVQRKFKIQIVDYSGRLVLIIERPYSCCLDATNNCWMCCCWLGSIGGDVSVKQADGTLIGHIVHSFGCYRPKYSIVDIDGNVLMKIKGKACGDCCNVVCSYIGCSKPSEFHITNEDRSQFIGAIKKTPMPKAVVEVVEPSQPNIIAGAAPPVQAPANAIIFAASFPGHLKTQSKALIVGALFLIDFMYFESGPTFDLH